MVSPPADADEQGGQPERVEGEHRDSERYDHWHKNLQRFRVCGVSSFTHVSFASAAHTRDS